MMSKAKRIRTRLGWRWLTALGMAMSLVAGIVVTDNAKAQVVNQPQRASNPTTLQKYSWDLTASARQGRFDSLTERAEESARAIRILASDRKNNPVVLSDSQAVRDLVAVNVARHIARGEVPETLLGKRLYKLNLEALFHDSHNAQELVTNLS